MMFENENFKTKKICNASKWAVTGFMGAGKSWFIEKLRFLGKNTEDLDHIIETSQGKTISKLISEGSVDAFRNIEDQCLEDFLNDEQDSFFLALGGGALNDKNFQNLRSHGVHLIFLDTPFEVCYQRIKNCSQRPLAQLSKSELEKLYHQRIRVYQKADITLKLKSDLNPVELKEILLNQGIKF